MRKYIDIINEQQKDDVAELEEGWKSAMASAALGAAAMAGVMSDPEPAPDSEIHQHDEMPEFSEEEQEEAVRQGYSSAEQKYLSSKSGLLPDSVALKK